MTQVLPNRMTDIEVARPAPLALGHSSEPTPNGLLQICWRRRWLVTLCILLCVGAATAYVLLATPLYTGMATLYVQKTQPVIFQNGVQFTDRSDTYLNTQTSLITCAPVVQAAVADLQVKYQSQGKRVDEMATFNDGSDPVAYIRKYLDVEIGKKDNLITVALDSPDAQEAADIVNSVVMQYRADQLDQYKSTSSKVLDILNQEKAAQEATLQKLENQVYTFRQEHPALGQSTDKGSIVIEKLAKLSEALTNAQIAAIYARVEYAESNAKGFAATKLQMAETNEKEVQRAFDAQQQEALKLNMVEIEFNRLTTQLERARKLIAALETRESEVKINDTSGGLNIRLLEPAIAPNTPSKPQKARWILVAAALGLMLGTGAAYWRDSTDHRLASVEEVGAALGLPVLGLIPSMPGRQTAVTRGQKVHLDSMSDVAEAFRTLRTVVYFSAPGEGAKTLMLTSPSAGEGKSTTASGLAIAMAKAGRRTLLVDTDLRKPTLHRIFEIDNHTGLSSVMAGKVTLDDAIRRTTVDGLDLLPCGPLPLNPSELLNSQAFVDLLEMLASRYDHILLDSPPALAVTDARILGAVCDLSILVLRAGASTKRLSEHACHALTHVGARMLGVVINDVPRRDRAYYGAGYSYGHYGYGQVQLHEEPANAHGNGHGNGHGHGGDAPRLPHPGKG